MKTRKKRPRPFEFWLLWGCMLFLALTGWSGGIALILDPTGVILGVSLRYMKGLPIHTYLLPGAFIMFFFGLFPSVDLYGLWARPRWPWIRTIEGWAHEHWAWEAGWLIAGLLLLWGGIEELMAGNWLLFHPILVIILGYILVSILLQPAVMKYDAKG